MCMASDAVVGGCLVGGERRPVELDALAPRFAPGTVTSTGDPPRMSQSARPRGN